MATKIVDASKEEITSILIEYFEGLPRDSCIDFNEIEEKLKFHLISVMPNEIFEIIEPLLFGDKRVANFGLLKRNWWIDEGRCIIAFKIVKLSNDLVEKNPHLQVSVIGLEED